MKFSDLGLSQKVLAAVETAGYETPTPIQEQAIPVALEGRDVLGIAQTGTGKTASFTLPMLNRLERGRARARMPRSLILEPTRELAAQVEQSFLTYGVNHKLTIALLIGGVSFAEQDRKLDRGADVLIATPGRLLDHFERGKLMLNGVELLVIDEADRMLDMGFIPDIERICKLIPFTRQTLFFSATMPPEIQRLTSTFLQNPKRVEVARPSSTASNIVQKVAKAQSEPAAKRAVLRDLLRSQTISNAIIFCNRKRDIAVLQRSLNKHGFDAGALHGDMDQHARLKTLDAFRNNEIQLLVASDVAARGLDIPEVSHVFNFDVPIHAEDYVHRIGRTGRAGREGHSFTIVTPRDTKYLSAIEKLISKQLEWVETDPNADSEKAPKSASDDAKPRRRGRKQAKEMDRDTDKSEIPVAANDDKAEAAKTEEPKATSTDDSKKPRGRDKSPKQKKKQMAGAFGGDEYIPAFLQRPVRAAR